MSDENQSKAWDWARNLLTMIAIGVASWSLKWSFDANARLAVVQQEQTNSANSTRDDNQDQSLKALGKNFWRQKTWTDNQINQIRIKNDMGIAQPADLGN